MKLSRRNFLAASAAIAAPVMAAPRILQGTLVRNPARVACIGDSNVNVNGSYGRLMSSMFPTLLQTTLEAEVGRPFKGINWGWSGDTTRASTYSATTYPGILNRLACITGKSYVPELVVIYGTTNNWTCINAGGSFTAGPSTTTADVDEDVTLEDLKDIIDALVTFGVQRIVVCGYHLRNWASGGDVTAGVINTEPSLVGANPGTFGAGARWAQYQAAQYGISTYSGKVAWCDLYAKFKTRLEADAPAQIGVDTYLHVAASNVHLNDTGNLWVADAITEVVAAQSGWSTALASA